MTDASNVNVGNAERIASTVGGGALAVYGLSRKSFGGALIALLGVGLAYRGATGHCSVYYAFGVDTAQSDEDAPDDPQAAIAHSLGQKGIKVQSVQSINKTADELYQFWRNFANLPGFMDHLVSVTVQDGGKSHWVAKAPLGRTVEWDAEIINDKPGELIAWRSLPGADVDSAGSVQFRPGPTGRGTEVRVDLSYLPPAGKVGATVAKLLGEEPQHQIDRDLIHFKNVMETGERPTTEGQPSGRGPDKDQMK
jgi:uncharacterized membrane protein